MASVRTCAVIAFAEIVASGCNPVPSRATCNLPIPDAGVPLEHLTQVATSSVFSDQCPAAVAKKVQLATGWGVWNVGGELYVPICHQRMQLCAVRCHLIQQERPHGHFWFSRISVGCS